MDMHRWSSFPTRPFFGSRSSHHPGASFNIGDLSYRDAWRTSVPSSYDGYTSSASDATDTHTSSFSGSEVTSKKISEPSAWSLVSAASTSTSSFYPAYASLPASKQKQIAANINNLNTDRLQQQEVSINFGKENVEDDTETEKAPTICSVRSLNDTTKQLLKSTPASLDKLHASTDEKQPRSLGNDATGKGEQTKKLLARVAELEALNEEQRKTISVLREENVKQKMELMQSDKDHASLLVRNASLCHQIDYEKREWSIEREQLAMQLDDVTRELELQKMLLNSQSISDIVQRWESKVFELQGMIYDRDRAIRAQQQHISELKKSSPVSISRTPSLDYSSSAYGSMKRVAPQFLANRLHRNAEHPLKAMANVLPPTSEEDSAVRRNMKAF